MTRSSVRTAVTAVYRTTFAHLAIDAHHPHVAGKTDASRKYAVHSASVGKYYLLYERKAVEGHEAVAAITYPSPQNPQRIDSAAAAIAFAKDHLGATDDDFAAHPGDA